VTLKCFGVETIYVDLNAPIETILAPLKLNTKVVFAETIQILL
jgi:O-acetylhomoserine/O-acetylserine sulfhydrylase-like pyridoxal-dependent enzyme